MLDNSYINARKNKESIKHAFSSIGVDAIDYSKTQNRYKRNTRNTILLNVEENIKNVEEFSFLHKAYENAANIDYPKKKSITHAAVFYNLLQILIPGLSLLTEEDIYNPTSEQEIEIHRLKNMLNTKGEISLLGVRLTQINSEIRSVKRQLSLSVQKHS
ncbi:hypothetical protein COBT_002706, partial [Conglomerata obtusa]